MLDPKTAIVPGSFDPITLGHVDVIERASQIFDRVVVAVAANAEKSTVFSADERLEMARLATSHIINAQCVVCEGLLSECAKEYRAGTLVKGVRSVGDFDYETQLAAIMRAFDRQLDTVFIPARAEYAHISSTYARELIRYGCDLERAVPKSVIPRLRELK
jgi:pantetheine-phosphate adenylyltransferase